ncbi:FimB/Mfa2 family fimbrial subunit [Bacteroides heparinolyticus]|uniref:FimB/Mfa2 family fimbrial subunit n=1 Tax=Prevotella heparinolytica TaxID=28113 RepID=UPI00359F8E9C
MNFKQNIQRLLPCLIVLLLTSCVKEPIHSNQKCRITLHWADPTDNGKEMKDVKIWIYGADGILVTERHYTAAQTSTFEIPDLNTGEYDLVAAVDLLHPFSAEDIETFGELTLRLANAPALNGHAYYGVTHINVNDEKEVITRTSLSMSNPLFLRRILSEFTAIIEDVPEGCTLEVSVLNSSDGLFPARKDADDSFGGGTDIRQTVTTQTAMEQNGKITTVTLQLMPTAGGDEKALLRFLFHLPGGGMYQCDAEAPPMKPGGRYTLTAKYFDLKATVNVAPVSINDWEEAWTVVGEIPNPANQ